MIEVHLAFGLEIPALIALAGLVTSVVGTGVATAQGMSTQQKVARYQKKEGERARALAAAQMAVNTAEGAAKARYLIAARQASEPGLYGPSFDVANSQVARTEMDRVRKENFAIAWQGAEAESATRMRAATAKAQRTALLAEGATRMGSTLIYAGNTFNFPGGDSTGFQTGIGAGASPYDNRGLGYPTSDFGRLIY